jgi:hypothetical protein
MNQTDFCREAGNAPVNPDSLLARHFERHRHLYQDFSACLACLFSIFFIQIAARLAT